MKQEFLWSFVRRKYFRWRAAELLCCLFAVCGLITAAVDYEWGYSNERTHDRCVENYDPLLRFLTMFFTMISIVLLGFMHYLKLKIYRTRSLSDEKKKFLSLKFIIKVAILFVFPYPGVQGSFTFSQSQIKEKSEVWDNSIDLCYTYSEILFFFMFGRFFFVCRTMLKYLFNYTPYQDNHSRAECLDQGIKPNPRFSIKVLLEVHSFTTTIFSIIPSFLLFGFFLRIFERPYTDVSGKNYDSIENAAWSSFVTMTMIGYGDFGPSTFPGRCVAILCSMWGAYAFSMIIFTMRKALELNKHEAKALTEIKLTRSAGKVICEFLCFCQAKKQGRSGKDEKENLRQALSRFNGNLIRIKSLKRKIGFKDSISKRTIKSIENRIKNLNQKILLLVKKNH